MKKFLVVAVLVLGYTVPTLAGEYKWFAHETIGFKVSNTWEQVDLPGGMIGFEHKKFGEGYAVIVTSPSPSSENSIQVHTGLHLGALFLDFAEQYGAGQVFKEDAIDVDGYPGCVAAFAMSKGNAPTAVGVITGIDCNGYYVTITAIGKAEKVDSFLDAAKPLVSSFTFDEDAADENEEELRAIGDVWETTFATMRQNR